MNTLLNATIGSSENLFLVSLCKNVKSWTQCRHIIDIQSAHFYLPSHSEIQANVIRPMYLKCGLCVSDQCCCIDNC